MTYPFLNLAKIFLTIIVSLMALVPAQAASEPRAVKVCVLYFERLEHPFWAEIHRIFKHHPEAVVVPVAKPTDMIQCVLENNPEEILIFAHAFEIDSETTKLGFFFETSVQEAQQAYQKALDDTLKQYNEVISRRYYTPCSQGPRSAVACNANQKQAIKLRSILS